MKGIVAGVLTLIALQVFSSGKGPDAGGQLLQWINKGLKAAISPDVAAIPNTKKAPPAKSSGSSSAPSTGGISLPRNPPVGTVQV